MPLKPTKEQAWELLNQFTKTEYLLKHALAVAGVMRHFAIILGHEDDCAKWEVVGLLHDLDYEMFPNEHCIKVQEIMKNEGIDREYIHAVASHGYGPTVDIKPENDMEKVLYTIDELCGLITAVAIMRPSKSVLDLEVKSVKKKYKNANFAAGVSRELIESGALMLGLDLDYVIEQTIVGMREVAEEIGLRGVEAV